MPVLYILRILQGILKRVSIAVCRRLPQRPPHQSQIQILPVTDIVIPVVFEIRICIRSLHNPVMIGIHVINPVSREHQPLNNLPLHLQLYFRIDIPALVRIIVQIMQDIEILPVQTRTDATLLGIISDIAGIRTVLIVRPFIRIRIHGVIQGRNHTRRCPVILQRGPDTSRNPQRFNWNMSYLRTHSQFVILIVRLRTRLRLIIQRGIMLRLLRTAGHTETVLLVRSRAENLLEPVRINGRKTGDFGICLLLRHHAITGRTQQLHDSPRLEKITRLIVKDFLLELYFLRRIHHLYIIPRPLLDTIVQRKAKTGLSHQSTLRLHHNHTVCRPRTVNSRRSGILQNRDGLDIIWSDVADTGCKNGRLQIRGTHLDIRKLTLHRHSVHNPDRLRASVDGVDAPDLNLRICPRTPATHHIQTGYRAAQHLIDRGQPSPLDFPGSNGLATTRHTLATHRLVAHHNHLVHLTHLLLQSDRDKLIRIRGHLLHTHTDKTNLQHEFLT